MVCADVCDKRFAVRRHQVCTPVPVWRGDSNMPVFCHSIIPYHLHHGGQCSDRWTYMCQHRWTGCVLLPLLRRLCNAQHSFVCLSVCWLATLCKNYWTDLHENFTTDISVHKEELVKFWKSSAGSWNFLKDSSTSWDRALFHNLAHISGQSGQIFMKILPQN